MRGPRGGAAVLLELVRSGAGAVMLHPLRSAVTVLCVLAIVLPYVVGVGLSRGLRDEIESAVETGPDLHVTGVRFGRPAPTPLTAAALLEAIPGVTSVAARIVGEARIGVKSEPVVVIGTRSKGESLDLVEGRLFREGPSGEVIVGQELARRLGLKVGDVIPPFYRNPSGERLTTVVGIFGSDAPLWTAHAMVTSLKTAALIFAEPDAVTEWLVSCPASFHEPVADQIRRLPTLAPDGALPIRARVSTRGDIKARFFRRSLARETLFQLPLLVAIAVGLPLVLVTSGAGLVERRREAGLLRSVGWSTDALLFRSLVESVLIALIGASIAVIVAAVWLRWFGGAGIAPVLLPGADRVPGFRVPWRLTGAPVALAFALAVLIVGPGSLFSTWRAASAPPARTMR